jgi:hypothetical protein
MVRPLSSNPTFYLRCGGNTMRMQLEIFAHAICGSEEAEEILTDFDNMIAEGFWLHRRITIERA